MKSFQEVLDDPEYRDLRRELNTHEAKAPLRAATNYGSMAGLSALQNTGKHVYAGTVDPAEVARRRAANKKARAARKKAHRARSK